MKKIWKIAGQESFQIVVLLALAFFLRIKDASLNFLHDEVYMVEAVKAIAKLGVPRLPSGFVYYRAFPVSYLGFLSGKILGRFDETALRLPGVLVGVLAVLVLYRLAKEMVGKKIAFLTALTVAVSPWQIMYSFFFRFYIFLPLLMLGITFCFYRFVQTGRIGYVVAAAGQWLLFATLSEESLLSAVHLPLLAGAALLGWGKRRRILGLALVVLLLFGIDYGAVDKLTRSFWVRYSTFPAVLAGEKTGQSRFEQEIVSGRISGLLYRFHPDLGAGYGSLRKQLFPTRYYLVWLIRAFPLGMALLCGGTVYLLIRKRPEVYFPAVFWLGLVFLSVVNPISKFQPRYVFPLSLLYFFSLAVVAQVINNSLVSKRELLKVISFKKWGWLVIGAVFWLSADLGSLGALWNLNYGKRLPRTMQISESYQTFPDILSPVAYVNQTAVEDDVVVSLQPRSQAGVYLARPLDYYLWTNRDGDESYLDENGVVRDQYGNIPVLTTAAALTELIRSQKDREGRVFVISSMVEQVAEGYIDKATLRLLRETSNRVVQTSDYEWAKVYVFEQAEHYR